MTISPNWLHVVILLIIFLVALLVAGLGWQVALFVTAASAIILGYVGI